MGRVPGEQHRVRRERLDDRRGPIDAALARSVQAIGVHEEEHARRQQCRDRGPEIGATLRRFVGGRMVRRAAGKSVPRHREHRHGPEHERPAEQRSHHARVARLAQDERGGGHEEREEVGTPEASSAREEHDESGQPQDEAERAGGAPGGGNDVE